MKPDLQQHDLDVAERLAQLEVTVRLFEKMLEQQQLSAEAHQKQLQSQLQGIHEQLQTWRTIRRFSAGLLTFLVAVGTVGWGLVEFVRTHFRWGL